jgi:hypothetical protein
MSEVWRQTADVDNSAAIDITDVVVLLGYLFLGDATPAPPGPTSSRCGPDPDAPGSPGDLGCESYGGCKRLPRKLLSG